MNSEEESSLHDGWGGRSLDMAADCWRLGIGAGMAVSEATDHRHRNNGQSWKRLGKVLGMQSQGLVGLVGLVLLGRKDLAIQPKSERRKRNTTLSPSLSL